MKISSLSKKFSKTMDASKKEEILEAAVKIFAKVGFKEATVRQICKLAQANVCLVSYYFGGKEGLYHAVFESFNQDKLLKLQQTLGNTENVNSFEEYKTRLQLLFESMFHDMLENQDYHKIMQREMFDGGPHITKSGHLAPQGALDTYIAFIEYGQKKKFLRKDINATILALSVVNMFVGFSGQVSFSPKKDMFFKGTDIKNLEQEINKAVLDIFFKGATP